MQHEQIFAAMRVDTYDGDIRLTAEEEKAVLRQLKDALDSAVSLFRTWNGYSDLATRLNSRLQITLRTRRLGSAHAWVAGNKPYYHQGSDFRRVP